jgi:hypothetical protein
MSTDAQNLAQLEKRLAELKAELDRQRRSLSAKQKTIMIVLILLVAAIGGYLFFISKKLNESLDADTLVSLAVEQVRPQIKGQISTLALQAKLKRTELIASASDFMRNKAPDLVFERAMESLKGIYGNELAKAETQINDAIDAGVITAKETLKERGIDLAKPDEFDKSAQKVAEIFAKESETKINDFYKKYTERSESFITILDRLGEGKDLNKRERHYRELITGVLAVLKKWHDEHPKGGPTNVLTPAAK